MSALSLVDFDFDDILKILPELGIVEPEIRQQIKHDATYAYYVARQAKDIEALRRDEALRIPDNFDYDAISGLSSEILAKLLLARPGSVGQASRIEGMTPAALLLILSTLQKKRDRKTA